MKKRNKMMVCAAIFTMLSEAMSSFAGEWKTDAKGYWYAKDDGGYAISEWLEDNGKWYYIGDDGYMVSSTWIGDYYVGADGVWIQDFNNELPVMPYAGLINQYRNYTSFKVELAFKKEDLIDRGNYYELENQEILYFVYNGNYDEEVSLYKGNVCVYKMAKTIDEGLTFEDAINNVSISKGNTYPMEAEYYYWQLWSPDEKGYFTEFALGYSG